MRISLENYDELCFSNEFDSHTIDLLDELGAGSTLWILYSFSADSADVNFAVVPAGMIWWVVLFTRVPLKCVRNSQIFEV